MMLCLVVYAICALAMLTFYLFPPTVAAREEQARVNAYFAERRLYQWALTLTASILWPLVLGHIWWDSVKQLPEWYDDDL